MRISGARVARWTCRVVEDGLLVVDRVRVLSGLRAVQLVDRFEDALWADERDRRRAARTFSSADGSRVGSFLVSACVMPLALTSLVLLGESASAVDASDRGAARRRHRVGIRRGRERRRTAGPTWRRLSWRKRERSWRSSVQAAAAARAHSVERDAWTSVRVALRCIDEQAKSRG